MVDWLVIYHGKKRKITSNKIQNDWKTNRLLFEDKTLQKNKFDLFLGPGATFRFLRKNFHPEKLTSWEIEPAACFSAEKKP